MNDYRNIDSIVDDATGLFTISNYSIRNTYSGIPDISDRVDLKLSNGHAIIVEVLEISDDRSLLKGKVINGYFPENQTEWIDAGTLVQFSSKKISGIYRK